MDNFFTYNMLSTISGSQDVLFGYIYARRHGRSFNLSCNRQQLLANRRRLFSHKLRRAARPVHGGASPQTAQIIKTLGEGCHTVTVTSNRGRADYAVLLDQEGGKGLAAGQYGRRVRKGMAT